MGGMIWTLIDKMCTLASLLLGPFSMLFGIATANIWFLLGGAAFTIWALYQAFKRRQ
jgi:hypothetical protein|tara:strand:- start:19 stop:189 length:171 start_codon:yes stop_codon:yes gene_type:complete